MMASEYLQCCVLPLMVCDEYKEDQLIWEKENISTSIKVMELKIQGGLGLG